MNQHPIPRSARPRRRLAQLVLIALAGSTLACETYLGRRLAGVSAT